MEISFIRLFLSLLLCVCAHGVIADHIVRLRWGEVQLRWPPLGRAGWHYYRLRLCSILLWWQFGPRVCFEPDPGPRWREGRLRELKGRWGSFSYTYDWVSLRLMSGFTFLTKKILLPRVDVLKKCFWDPWDRILGSYLIILIVNNTYESSVFNSVMIWRSKFNFSQCILGLPYPWQIKHNVDKSIRPLP